MLNVKLEYKIDPKVFMKDVEGAVQNMHYDTMQKRDRLAKAVKWEIIAFALEVLVCLIVGGVIPLKAGVLAGWAESLLSVVLSLTGVVCFIVLLIKALEISWIKSNTFKNYDFVFRSWRNSTLKDDLSLDGVCTIKENSEYRDCFLYFSKRLSQFFATWEKLEEIEDADIRHIIVDENGNDVNVIYNEKCSFGETPISCEFRNVRVEEESDYGDSLFVLDNDKLTFYGKTC